MDACVELILEWLNLVLGVIASEVSSSVHLSGDTDAVLGLAVTKCLEIFAEF